MKVRVQLFAILREVVGREEVELDGAEELTVGHLWEQLVSDHPDLGGYEHSIQFAVNHDFVSRDMLLKPEDEIAFLPPVSGG